MSDLRDLREKLIKYYNEPRRARMVASDIGLPTGGINTSDAADIAWSRIVEEADSRGLIDELVRRVRDDYPNFNWQRATSAAAPPQRDVPPQRNVQVELSGPFKIKVKISVLFFSACPDDATRIDTDREYSRIEESLEASTHRDSFELFPAVALQLKQFSTRLLQRRPRIVHYAGHANAKGQFLFEQDDGAAKPVPAANLAAIFKAFRATAPVSLVMLNCCYGQELAEALRPHVDCVIGTTGLVGVAAAQAFAEQFYAALFNGATVQEAFDVTRAVVSVDHAEEYRMLPREGVDPALLLYL